MKCLLRISHSVVLIAASVCFPMESLRAQWQPVSTGFSTPNHQVFSISVVDTNVIWAVVDTTYGGAPVPNNFIPRYMRTTDGGGTWMIGTIPGVIGRWFMDICALDANTAWVTTNRFGGAGEIYKTTNGGLSWVLQIGDPSVWVHFFDYSDGVAVNLYIIYFTTDGGITWQSPSSVPVFDPDEYNIIFSGNNSQGRYGDTVWNGTSKGRVYRSTNRGRDWTIHQTSLGRNACISSLAFQDGRNGLAASCLDSLIQSAPNRIARTTDGGLSWTELAAPSTPRAEKVAYVPGTSGVFVLASSFGATGSAYTTNFGATWLQIDNVRYQSVAFVGPNKGWAGGRTNFHPGGMYRWVGSVLTRIEDESRAPENFTLFQNFPNPFNPTTNIKFQIPNTNFVTLRVYNVLGQEVVTLVNEEMKLGTYTVEWNAEGLASGVYYYRLQAGQFVETKKLILLK